MVSYFGKEESRCAQFDNKLENRGGGIMRSDTH